MTNKEKVIQAIKQLMEHFLGGIHESCPLCLIFKPGTECAGCPNRVFGNCLSSLTYGKLIYEAGLNSVMTIPTAGKTHPRLLFWQEVLPIIKKLPNKAFTVKGYKNEYFKPLIEIDQRIYNNYIKQQNHEQQ